MVKRNKFVWKKRKQLLLKHEPCTKGNFKLRRKKKFMNFSDQEKVDIKDDLSLVFPNLACYYKKWE